MLVFSQNNKEYFSIINIKYYLLNHTYNMIRRCARTHVRKHTHKYLASKVCSVCLILHHDVHASRIFFSSVKPYSSIFQVPGRKKYLAYT